MGLREEGCMFLKKGRISRKENEKRKMGEDWYTLPHYGLLIVIITIVIIQLSQQLQFSIHRKNSYKNLSNIINFYMSLIYKQERQLRVILESSCYGIDEGMLVVFT